MRAPWWLRTTLFCGSAALLAACGDAPSGPADAPDLGRPQFNHVGTANDCRYFGYGSAALWVGPSHWEGLCPIQVYASPVEYMGSANPGTVTFEFAAPVLEVRSAAIYTCPTFCPTTHMTYSAYRADGTTIVADRPFDESTDLWGKKYYSFDLRGLGLVKRIVLTPPVPMPPDGTEPGKAIKFDFDYAIPCPTTGDSVLDNAQVRHRLNEEWGQSAIEFKERGGWILRNEATAEHLVWADPNAVPRDRCNVNFTTTPPDMPGYTPIRIWHTHIVPAGMPRQFLIGDCPRLPERFISGNGPSVADQVAKTERTQKPHIVIDDNELWLQYPMSVGGGTFKWNWINGCRKI